jgi:two-component system phosphate regulon sensor histidine kinase PhoR
MRRFKLKEQIIIKFLITDFMIISIIGLILLATTNNYRTTLISTYLLLIASPFIFFFSWYLSSRINTKLERLNDAITKMADGKFDLQNITVRDELDQVWENLVFTAKKISSAQTTSNLETNKYKLILNELNNGVFLVSDSGEVIFANKTVENIFNRNDWQNKEVIEVFQNHDLARLVDKAMLGKASSEKIDIIYPKPKTLSLTFLPIEGKEKIIKGCAVIVDDLTAYERLADVKKDLLANVSHELRTPVAAIKSLTDALVASKLENKIIANKFL